MVPWPEEPLAHAHAALREGRWGDARGAFEQALANDETAEAYFGLAAALWWLGENHACVDRCSHAYSLFRRSGDVEGAAQCAVWLAITYKANFANFAAANGWIGRAERLLQAVEPGPLLGWVWVARAYRMADLDGAEDLAARAVEVARSAGDVDLELVALAQLGLVRVGKGETDAGFALIDEAMAAVLAGERSTLDTVVYACCHMLNACELASDIERAAQWCAVADDFVATYGCPFLYAECRIYYGSVLTAKGRWDDAERELGAGLRITAGACPGLHTKALTHLAGLRTRQGRLEEAEQLLAHLGEGVEARAEEALSLGALLLARGDAPAASRNLEQRLHHLEEHRSHLAAALELLIDAHLATGDPEGAGVAARR
ncbi:MAG: LuxR family transcriptional regulator, partial [Acidimicrobiales bacterium]